MATARPARRAEELWMRVMREGRSMEEVARQHGLTLRRLEKVLIAFGHRRLYRATAAPH